MALKTLKIDAASWRNFWFKTVPKPYSGEVMCKKLMDEYSICHWVVENGSATISYTDGELMTLFVLKWSS